MVNPGSSAHRHQARSKADPARPHHRMVTLAQSSPGDRSACAPQSKTATVMLGAPHFTPRLICVVFRVKSIEKTGTSHGIDAIGLCKSPFRPAFNRVRRNRGGFTRRNFLHGINVGADINMRILGIVALGAALGGCASSSAGITPAYVSPVSSVHVPATRSRGSGRVYAGCFLVRRPRSEANQRRIPATAHQRPSRFWPE